jgi:hypothetical protein
MFYGFHYRRGFDASTGARLEVMGGDGRRQRRTELNLILPSWHFGDTIPIASSRPASPRVESPRARGDVGERDRVRSPEFPRLAAEEERIKDVGGVRPCGPCGSDPGLTP